MPAVGRSGIVLPSNGCPVLVIEDDCANVLTRFGDWDIQATITDPPYGVELGVDTDRRGGGPKLRHGLAKRSYLAQDTYESFVREIVPRLSRAIDLAARAAVFTGPHIHEQRKPNALGGVYVPAACGRNAWGFKQFIPVLFYGKAPDLHRGAREPTVIVSNDTAEESDHPCPKPLTWMRWLIRLCSRPGELILDPFAGSGTTGVAAILEGRRCLLIEREPRYAALCRQRISEAVARVQTDGSGKRSAPPKPKKVF